MSYLIIGTILIAGGFFVAQSMKGQSSNSASFETIDVPKAKELIKSQKPVILDVRTPMEVSSGKIKNAINVNVASPSFKTDVAKMDKNATYIVYCRSGRRSVNACNIMNREGFTNLYNLAGGFNAWK